MDFDQARDVMLARLPRQDAYAPQILMACGHMNEAIRLRELRSLCDEAFDLWERSSSPGVSIFAARLPHGFSKSVYQALTEAHELLLVARDEYYREAILPLVTEARNRLGLKDE